jgi:hypothetical protein
MEHDVEASGGDPSVADLQDFYLNAESRAALTRDYLAEMIDAQRNQAETVVAKFTAMTDALQASEKARIYLDDENRRQASRISELERQLKLVHVNYARLSESYSSMMSVVEDTHSNSIGLGQRIEAMLVQNDLGLDRHAPQGPARRVTEFRDGVFAHPALRHPDQRPSEMLREVRHQAPHHESEFTTYGHDTYAARPLSALRNER